MAAWEIFPQVVHFVLRFARRDSRGDFFAKQFNVRTLHREAANASSRISDESFRMMSHRISDLRVNSA